MSVKAIPKEQIDISPKVQEFFWKRVNVCAPDECWEWTGAHNKLGYGTIVQDRKHLAAHRVSYLIHYNDLPSDKLVRHKCDNPKCVNPAHLELGTKKDNARDMVERDRSISLLTTKQVIKARKMRASGMKVRAIMKELDIVEIGDCQVGCAIRGITWSHLTDPPPVTMEDVKNLKREQLRKKREEKIARREAKLRAKYEGVTRRITPSPERDEILRRYRRHMQEMNAEQKKGAGKAHAIRTK